MKSEPTRAELKARLQAAEETIRALKQSAIERQSGLGGGAILGIRKAMANLQNSLAERRRELEATMDRYRALFDHSPLMGFTLDRSGVITSANRSAREGLTLPDSANLIGQTWQVLFKPESIADVAELLAGHDSQPHDLHLTNGALVEAVVAQVPGHNETQLLLHDVTEHRSIEERLRHSQKMDALGQLAGGVAHDFNNLLSAIIGYTELMQARPDPTNVASFTTEVLSASRKAADLVSHLLAFSRSEPTSLQPVDLNAIAQNVERIASRTFDRRITVESEQHAKRAVVSGDSSLLESALLNLAINARDAMPTGGTLRITTTNVPMPLEVLPGPSLEGDVEAIELCISDTGEGMDPEVLARMFDPFFTTKPLGRGTGLGLAATYGTVKRHNGTIRVHSSPGKGTRFCVYLPISSEEGQEHDHEVDSPQDSLRILMIDDEQAVRHTTQLLLESLGHRVEIAEDARSGLAALSTGPPFDLVLLDLMLPDMHGNEVLARLRKDGSELPVLVISGYSPKECGPGADGFLRKPFTRAGLAEAIASLWASRG